MVNKLSYMKLHEATCVTETLLFFFLFIEICQPLPLDKRKPFNQWKTDIPVPRWKCTGAHNISPAFRRLQLQLHVLASSFDWFIALSASVQAATHQPIFCQRTADFFVGVKSG